MNLFRAMSKTIGLGAVLCAACCALSLIGLLGSSAALSASFLSGGLECLLVAVVAITGIGVWLARRRKAAKGACQTSCHTDCGCKSQSRKIEPGVQTKGNS